MGKLTFKGDAPKKKKKHSSSSSKSKGKGADHDDDDLSGWLPIPTPSLALGPLYLTLGATSLTPPIALALQPTTAKLYPFVLPTPDSSNAAEDAAASSSALLSLDPDDLEAMVDFPTSTSSLPGAGGPSDVHHVWVCTRIPDSEDKVTFRSATSKFLASDEIGVVSADREARGMQEEWTIEPFPGSNGSGTDGVLIRNAYGKLLSVDVVAGGKLELRADESGEGGETEKWTVWMQGEFVAKAKKALLERSGVKAQARAQNDGLVIVGDLASAEIDSIKKYQARGQGRLVGTTEDIRELKKARKAGQLSEAMLERRVKLKSDRYC